MITLQTQNRFNNSATLKTRQQNVNFGTGVEAVIVAGIMSGMSFLSGLKIGESMIYKDSVEISKPIKAVQDTLSNPKILKDTTKIR